MEYRRFGRSGLQVSQVVFGAGYVGGIVILADDDTRRHAQRRPARGADDLGVGPAGLRGAQLVGHPRTRGRAISAE